MNILISSYAAEPNAGSEYGVGWMVPTTMAKNYPEHSIYVLTRSRCKEKIQKEETELNLPNLHFLYYDIKKWMTYPNEMQSKWGEQINYILWQIGCKAFIRKKHETIKFDIIHHLTFNQYRTPSPGFWLDIPFVMGPIGGAECINPVFWQDLDKNTRQKEIIRRKGKDLKIFSWFNHRNNNKKIILCSCKDNFLRLKPYAGKSILKLMPAIAYDKRDFEVENILSKNNERSANSNQEFEMIYAGKAWDWKGLKIFLNAVKFAFANTRLNRPWKIKLIGIRFKEEQERVQNWIKEFGLENNVILIPFIQRSELLKLMKNCSLSIYPAFRDSGSMSILEASALGCPTICFEAGGQDIFPDDILIKIPVDDTYEKTLMNFAEKIRWTYEHEEEAKEIGLRSQKWVSNNLTWNQKVNDFIKIYEDLIQ